MERAVENAAAGVAKPAGESWLLTSSFPFLKEGNTDVMRRPKQIGLGEFRNNVL